jgi:pimeloyl-ACP methyl ester carboxylesterase
VPAIRPSAAPWSAARRRKVRVRDFDCHVTELGDPGQPALLLVHGWPQHSACWRHVAPELARHFHVVMPDLRGMGQSIDAPLAPGQGCKEELARDLIALLDVMGLSKVHAIGHDWGGWTTFVATLRYPQRFHRYICLGVPHPWQRFDWPLLKNLWRFWYQLVAAGPWAGPALRATPGFVTRFTRMNLAHPERWSAADFALHADAYRNPSAIAATRRVYTDFILREFMPVGLGRYRDVRATVPTRLVLGRADRCISWELGRGMDGRGDNLALQIWDDVGHFIPEEAPQRVIQLARSFFEVSGGNGDKS